MAKLPVIDVGLITAANPTDEHWASISKEIGSACLTYGRINLAYFAHRRVFLCYEPWRSRSAGR